MPVTECKSCCGRYWWRWEEAFDRFGFNGGEGEVMTDTVAKVLHAAGYQILTHEGGDHSPFVAEIAKDGRRIIPADVKRGYDKPRQYLPAEVIALLDEKLPEGAHLES